MLISREITTIVNGTMTKYYNEKGYNCKTGESINVKIEDLKPNSNLKVKIKCDYCGEIFEAKYFFYLKGHQGLIDKDCCKNCTILKMQDVMEIKYGEKVTQKIKQVKEKTQSTNLQKYGTKEILSNKIIRDKIKNTNLKKYGVEYGLSNEKIRNKIKKTNLEKYGVENPAQNNEIKEKTRQTNLEKYNIEYVILDEKYKQNFKKYIKVSKQQKYIADLYKGKLNIQVKGYYLDIKLQDNIYCEYNGTGHNLSVKLRGESQENFEKRELQRYYILKREGLKEFKIINTKSDELPSDEILIKMKETAIEYLKEKNHNWIEFNFDKNKIITKDFIKDFCFGNLRKI